MCELATSKLMWQREPFMSLVFSLFTVSRGMAEAMTAMSRARPVNSVGKQLHERTATSPAARTLTCREVHAYLRPWTSE